MLPASQAWSLRFPGNERAPFEARPVEPGDANGARLA
jgi:hypothetical protein